jgi:lipopolysaccharide export system permease protein
LGILQRYIWREVTVSFLSVTSVLLAILLVYQGGAVLARAAEQQYPGAVVLKLLGLGALQNVALLLPFGLLLAVVLSLGRLYSDNEMFAAQACGYSFWRSLIPILAVALPVALLTGWITLALAPQAVSRQSELRDEALRNALAVPIQAGQFRALAGGRAVVYARKVGADGALEGVFIKRSKGSIVEATVAQHARIVRSADGQTQILQLNDGERLEGAPGTNNWRVLRFREQLVPLALATKANATDSRRDQRPTKVLLAGLTRSDQAELQYRVSWPLMVLLLAVIAVPLARLKPRQGRFSRVWIAVVLFALYANLVEVATQWIERGQLAAWLGAWWVHGIVALAGGFWLFAPRLRLRRAGG